jgi:hypothetical protein
MIKAVKPWGMETRRIIRLISHYQAVNSNNSNWIILIITFPYSHIFREKYFQPNKLIMDKDFRSCPNSWH